ncbi:hypothetical protein M409DRAFT_51777 [Zasmidium cellare ATCC 36951]|uniref:Small ribosomal subunit protein mS35 mitochondrial conserved domain-containing protein n=1 Tax=Zasmidium cellare ATCC 36951 TaxID=1080233 RepID=A0A6A6CXA6_ZASCE|nr:uncharacterized protein M409DRAFT_51777 [Zasmidium cellare ATCC 36951]KAF2169996.1 hypothetical protein M409DRAFT_51777 [Zasmidium cellare ATCC 36951]
MATPMKRICCQAAREASKYRSSSTTRTFLAESRQCQNTPSRTFTSTSTAAFPRRRGAPQNNRRQDEESFFEKEHEEVLEDEPEIDGLINESEISSTGYAELEQHRELREMVRLAAWEMPLLSSLSKPYEQPDPSRLPLRWRYTTYFGESHPASRKVVVEYKIADLAHQGLKQKHLDKLRKLVGARYNPETDVVKMSCESLETQAQNKRFLGDTIEKLIAEAKDPKADTFEDVPLDTRHHKFKPVFRFPEEWKLTQERRVELEARRRTLLLEEGQRVEENRIVSGMAAIEAERQLRLKRVEEPVMVEARQPLARGKQGRKEMGQTAGAQRY